MPRIHVVTIGRSSTNTVSLGDRDGTVSRRHAELTLSSTGDVLLTDCDSTCGTYVYDRGDWVAITQQVVRRDDDVRLGNADTVMSIDDILRSARL